MIDKRYSRKKDPERVKQALIDSTAALVVELGSANVTVAAVAAGAGVTKGALFHHFADRDALIAGMFDHLLTRLDGQIETLMAADPIEYGRFTRAYVNAALADEKDDRRIWVALIGSLTSATGHACRWYDWLESALMAHPSEDVPMLETVRLAADGAWLAVTTRLSPLYLERLRGNLLSLTVDPDGRTVV